jgi:hypothetical protein
MGSLKKSIFVHQFSLNLKVMESKHNFSYFLNTKCKFIWVIWGRKDLVITFSLNEYFEYTMWRVEIIHNQKIYMPTQGTSWRQPWSICSLLFRQWFLICCMCTRTYELFGPLKWWRTYVLPLACNAKYNNRLKFAS